MPDEPRPPLSSVTTDGATLSLLADTATLRHDHSAAEVPGYEILGELGRGGMGVVYKARQVKADRVVALKMILSGAHAGAQERARFQTEAQAVARLRHPHIVQVYEVGEHNGLPFFSLEFCDAGSLDRRLAGTPLPPGDAAALVETLARAVQAAHEAGVIHRDLKPPNVLLSFSRGSENRADEPARFCEPRLNEAMPKIADFGLARKLDAPSAQTATGAVMGTPSYMAPEQADGRGKTVGPAVDIYALGAILYECLTGRPPFRAAAPLDTLMQVLQDEPVPPRQLNPKVPRDLETVALKCLRKEPGRRYASALALADDLRRFQNGEPVRARPVGLFGRTTRWVRRRPAIAALLAVLVLVTAAGVGGIAWKWREALASEARAVAQREQAEKERRRTRQVLDDVTAGALDSLLARQKRLTDEHRAFLRKTLDHFLEFAGEPGDDPEDRADVAAAHVRMASIRNLLGEYAEAERAHDRACALYAGLAEEFPNDRHHRRRHAAVLGDRALLRGQAGRLKDAEEAHGHARDVLAKLVADFPDEPQHHFDLAMMDSNFASLLWTTGRPGPAEERWRTAAAVLEKLVADHPSVDNYRDGLATCRLGLAEVFRQSGRPRQAEVLLDQAVEGLGKAEGKTVAERARRATAHMARGHLLFQAGRLAKAEADLRAAEAIRRQLTTVFPAVGEYRADLGSTRYRLGQTLQETGRFREAEEVLRDAVELLRQAAAEFPDGQYRVQLASAHGHLGELLRQAGKPAEADFRTAVGLWEKLVEENPRVPVHQADLATARINLANVLTDGPRRAGAVAEYRRAVALLEALAKQFPAVPTYRSELARAHNGLGTRLKVDGQSAAAEEAYRTAIGLLRELIDKPPAPPKFLAELARAHNNLGLLLGQAPQGEQALRDALALWHRLVAQFPATVEYRIEAGGGHSNLGQALGERGSVEEALKEFDAAIALLGEVLKGSSGHPTARLFLRNSHWGRAGALTNAKRHREAAADWQRCAELDAGTSRTWFALQGSLARARAGETAEAVRDTDALAARPDVPAPMLLDLARIRALAAAADPANEAPAAAALALLEKARAAGHFKDAARARLIEQDADFASLRSRPAFGRLFR